MSRSLPQFRVLTARVGAGHVQAARAIEEAFVTRGMAGQVRSIDVMERVPSWFRTLYAGGYTALVTRFPRWYDRLYRMTDQSTIRRLGPVERLRIAVEAMILRGLRDEIAADRPDWLIHTHFLPAASCARWRASFGWPIRQAVVVTDFHPHRIWRVKCVDRYFVASDVTRRQLIESGVEAHTIDVTGIPILARHREPTDRAAVFRDFRWPPDRPVILLLAGSDFVSGPVERAIDRLLRAFPEVTLQVAAGRNAALHDRTRRRMARFPNLRVIGHTDRINELLDCATVVLSKTGGVTTSECLAHGACLVALFSVPGQEAHNADYLVERGAALGVLRLAELVEVVGSLLSNPGRRANLQTVARTLGRANAAERIVSDVTRSTYERTDRRRGVHRTPDSQISCGS